MRSYRKLTKAERKPRKAKLYSSFEDKEVWWYIGRGVTEFFAHVADGTVVRVVVGTRYLKGAIKKMEKELAARAMRKRVGLDQFGKGNKYLTQ